MKEKRFTHLILNKMDYKTINTFPIWKYLAGLNIYPAKERGYYGMYYSPFREDNDASMKVDYNKNLWIDYGASEGGTLIDLVMRMENCTNGEAMRLLEQKLSDNNSLSFHGNNIPNRETGTGSPSPIQITGITSISSPALFDYLGERKINIDIAKLHCKEVHYSVNGKNYFAIGFNNDTNGYELRNKYFKGCTNKDKTTHLGSDKDACLVFEGFIDYLSFLTLKSLKSSIQNIVILNSITNLPRALKFIQSHPKVYTYLDNDEAGRKTTQQIKSVCASVSDQSTRYRDYKDLNDLLCGKKMAESIQAGLQESKLAGKDSSQQENKKTLTQPPVKKRLNRGMKR